MSINPRLKPSIKEEIKVHVKNRAEQFNYRLKSNVENSQFIESLVRDKDIGVRLSQFMPKEKIRVYIKDAILKRISKEWMDESRPEDEYSILQKHFGMNFHLFDEEKGVKVYISESKENERKYVITAIGTYLKWESALRKAILYPTGKPFAEEPGVQIHIIILLNLCDKKIPNSEKDLLYRSLFPFGVVPYFFAEG
jgi:hypothetical protein